MTFKHSFIAILVFSNIVLSLQQDQPCSLPDNKGQSSCMPLHRCDHLQNIIKQYNGNPPPNEASYIRKHVCLTNSHHVCCPSENQIIETTNAPTTLQMTTAINLDPVERNDAACYLPDNKGESTCMLLHHCDHLQNKVKEHNGNPPPDVVNYIKKHICMTNRNHVCCPTGSDRIDTNVFTTQTPTTKTTQRISFQSASNDKSCTLPRTNRQSKCVLFKNCNHYQNIIKQYTLLPMDVLEDIKLHACQPAGHVCCPDYSDNLITTKLDSPEGNQCTLPMSRTLSNCTALRNCKYFQNIVNQFTILPIEVSNQIASHSCAPGDFVCCPHVAPLISTTIPVNLPSKTNLYALKSHHNFYLINERTCGISSSDRVMGGYDAELFEIPWAVLLGYESDLEGSIAWNCGGSLISKRFVLTAAHCIKTQLKLVRIGEHRISTRRDCKEYNNNACADPIQDIYISNIIEHPNFNRGTKTNDIALLKLAAEADTTKNNVKTICLPVDDQVDIDRIRTPFLTFKISGWGSTNEFNTKSDVLQKANLPFVDHNECIIEYAPLYPNITIYDTFLCAGGHNKTDACNGDSGGGFTATTVVSLKAKTILYGVVLGGVTCKNKDVVLPGVYTDIRYYLDWILDNMSR